MYELMPATDVLGGFRWNKCWILRWSERSRPGYNQLRGYPVHIEQVGEKLYINLGEPKTTENCLDVQFDTKEEALQYFVLAKAAEGT